MPTYSGLFLFYFRVIFITAKKVFVLVPFFIFSVIFVLTNNGVVSTIFDAIFVLAYIILGLIDRFNLLVFFAIGVLVLTILLQLFTVLNSMAVIISLLVVGFVLIFVAVIYGSKKKD